MGPPRRSKSVNKRYDEVSPNKEEYGSKRSSSRKKKLIGMLGPQWTKDELTRFYHSYRKNGKDWKKVACVVKNRSPDMLEALYSMNKAYLSLPHGTASAAGLIAMMTDHYGNMAGSDSDRDSNGGVGSSRKIENRSRGKKPDIASKALDEQYASYSPTAESNMGCMSLLKRKRSGTRPRPVGKRTPRFPVSFSHENTSVGIYSSPTKRLKLEDYANDEEVALALALAEASQTGGSPQVSGTPCKLAETVVSSHFRHTPRKITGAETATKIFPNERDEDHAGSTEADIGELMRPIGDGATRIKNRSLEGGNIETDIHNENDVDGIKEECSGTEEGHGLPVVGSKFDVDVNDFMGFSPTQTQRKKNKKGLFRKDEGPVFHALQTLADLSLLMPPENEGVPTLQLKENQDHVDESMPLEANPSNHSREKFRSTGVRMKGSLISEGSSRRTAKPRKRVDFDDGSVLEDKQDPGHAITKTTRKIKKVQAPKKKGGNDDILVTRTPRTETTDSGKKMVKKISENSSNADARKEMSNSGQSAEQDLGTNQDTLPTKVRCKRKMVAKKLEKDLKLSDRKSSDQSSLPEIAVDLKKKLSSCLSSQHLRRFCTFEWFYSAIDYPWFAKREFDEYLNHVGLGHVPRLTQTEWSFIRSSLGKPRRFSHYFLKQEKDKLTQYRESIRKHYTELREGTQEGLPTDLARPLSVGQHVIAIHPKTREIHDGTVLTVDHSRFHVQFNRGDLGVEFVMDTDCMPLNPIENMPAMLGRQTAFTDRYFENNEQETGGQTKEHIKFSHGDKFENIDGASAHLLPFANHAAASVKERKDQAKRADAVALAELTRALDKKDAIVGELRHMNDDVFESQKDDGRSLKDEDTFKKQYAAVLILLHEANEQVSSALCHLRQRNMYLESRQPASPAANLADHMGTWDPFDRPGDEAGSHVNEIMDSSRTKAQKMLNAAIQAMSSFEGRNDTIEKIEEVIDYVNDRLPTDEACVQPVTDQKSLNPPEVEAQYPYELIRKCIETMVIIQKCSERPFPPSDVAQILDHAATSLQPRSPQNLPIYTDIQKCFGIIKNQILALIPT